LAFSGAGAFLGTYWMNVRGGLWGFFAYFWFFPTGVSFFLVQFAALRLPSAKVIAYGYLTPAFVILFEGLAGHGWPGLSVFAGAAVTVLGLIVLAVIPD
jgi:drug/metabolite transporter (DMT)-like permease